MDESEIALVAEQLRRFQDNLESRLKLLEAKQDHHAALTLEQISVLRSQLHDLKQTDGDHEQRIRTIADTAAGFRLLFASTGIASLIALIKAFLP